MGKLILISDMENFFPKLDNVIPELENKNVVCIITAAAGEGFPDWMPKEMKPLKEKVKTFVEFDLEGKTRSETENALKDADVIYVMGGNTYYLLEHVQKSGFENILKNKLDNGAIYVGVSAGAAIVSPRIDYIENLDDPSKAYLTDFSGMTLVDFLVMPHIDHEDYGPKIIPIVDKIKNTKENIVGFTEHQGLYIDGSYMKVI